MTNTYELVGTQDMKEYNMAPYLLIPPNKQYTVEVAISGSFISNEALPDSLLDDNLRFVNPTVADVEQHYTMNRMMNYTESFCGVNNIPTKLMQSTKFFFSAPTVNLDTKEVKMTVPKTYVV